MPTTNCLICGAELEYYQTPRQMVCAMCKKEYETTVACKEGHFICDACHMEKGVAMILDFCQNTESRNPIAMLQQMMARPEIYMHGPEHHVMVGAALLAAYRNCGGRVDLSISCTAGDGAPRAAGAWRCLWLLGMLWCWCQCWHFCQYHHRGNAFGEEILGAGQSDDSPGFAGHWCIGRASLL